MPRRRKTRKQLGPNMVRALEMAARIEGISAQTFRDRCDRLWTAYAPGWERPVAGSFHVILNWLRRKCDDLPETPASEPPGERVFVCHFQTDGRRFVTAFPIQVRDAVRLAARISGASFGAFASPAVDALKRRHPDQDQRAFAIAEEAARLLTAFERIGNFRRLILDPQDSDPLEPELHDLLMLLRATGMKGVEIRRHSDMSPTTIAHTRMRIIKPLLDLFPAPEPDDLAEAHVRLACSIGPEPIVARILVTMAHWYGVPQNELMLALAVVGSAEMAGLRRGVVRAALGLLRETVRPAALGYGLAVTMAQLARQGKGSHGGMTEMSATMTEMAAAGCDSGQIPSAAR